MTVAGSLPASLPLLMRRLRSQYWAPHVIASYQQRRLEAAVSAASRIPFYAERLGSVRDRPQLDQLPILGRADVPALTRSVRTTRPPGKRLLSDRSSGSTGMPVEVLFDAGHQRGRFAARARYLLANGWTPLRRSAWIIYLPEGTPDGRLLRSRLLVNAHFLSVFTDLDDQLRWLNDLRPLHLYTMPSNLGALLDRAEETGVRVPSVRRIFCGGEVVDDALRARALAVLGVDIADNYGSTEAFLAWQCRSGGYHVNAEHVILEVVDGDGHPAAAEALGRVLVTTLENRLCPLIRYEIGDYAEPAEGPCRCGRTLPLLGRAAGRSVNIFRLEGGRLLSPWALVVRLKFDEALTQFQIVQRAEDQFQLRYVAPSALADDAETRIRTAFREVTGTSVAVSFRRAHEIPRTPTGKFMTAISELQPARESALD